MLKVNSRDLFDMNIADKIINEPLGGAHNDENIVFKDVTEVILNEHKYLYSLSKKKLVEERLTKYNNIGIFSNE